MWVRRTCAGLLAALLLFTLAPPAFAAPASAWCNLTLGTDKCSTSCGITGSTDGSPSYGGCRIPCVPGESIRVIASSGAQEGDGAAALASGDAGPSPNTIDTPPCGLAGPGSLNCVAESWGPLRCTATWGPITTGTGFFSCFAAVQGPSANAASCARVV